MSTMSDFDLLLQEIRQEMRATPLENDQIHIERTVSSIINGLDELNAFARNPSTRSFLEAEKIAIGTIRTRVELLLSFLLEHQPGRLRQIRGRA